MTEQVPARSRLVVVGSGIAGLIVAIAASSTHDVTLITKAELGESNTRYAQGGIAAAMFDDDSVASHIADTLVAGAGLNRLSAVEALCAEGPERIRDLIRLGVEFDRVPGGELARGLEAAHASARILHAGGDATGSAIERALVRAVRTTAARVLENTFVKDLVVDESGRVVGVEVVSAAACGVAGTITVLADAVVLASGGAGQLYAHTTNPAVTTGDGVAAAYRAGAELADVEFYQFHPTSLAVPGNFLVSEAVRGEGAVLRGADGARFMVGVHPDAELAPRDVVARAIAEQMAKQGGAPVLLDATELGAEFLERRFPSISQACRANGLDWGREPIAVTPAAHYWMGGVLTDDWGRSTVPGLFAVGEVACTGVHGANRLASNSLLESVVFAWRAVAVLQGHAGAGAARFVTEGWPDVAADAEGDSAWHVRALGDAPDSGLPTDRSDDASGDASDDAKFSRAALQQLMWNAVGVYRDAAPLSAAQAQFARWQTACDATPAETITALEDRNLLLLARLIAAAARQREESRGAHYRSDFPETSTLFHHHQISARKAALPT
ncbi:L-aspartate oxidase [Subtercola sp. RTI3]|uniref:L-aspartate oxidase n=1 Tax=Subtercola sp. RTI3 TaxID=3048639 RepID=UPI002B2237DE|nr:L-aspartate oxidase [Subtercola sp. RTI3]MEA9985247.1 L-aspartate oxidase [Subtercola sp. RTI3]